MKTVMTFVMTAVVALTGACGGDSGDDTTDTSDEPTPDAPASAADAAAAAVVEVTCPGAPDALVTTQGFAFSPVTTTIGVGGIVRFTPAADHNVVGDGIVVGFGGDTCFRFDAAGTYDFVCTPHGFQGHIEVQ